MSWDRVQEALDEVRAGHREAESFFGDVLQEFDALARQLGEYRREWEMERDRTEAELRHRAEELDRQEAAVAEREEALRTDAQQHDQRRDATHDRLEKALEDARAQQAQAEQQQAILEAELETVRNRAAELAETVAEQKRQGAAQQKQFSEELRQMRRLLQHIADCHERTEPAPRVVRPEHATAAATAAATPAADPVAVAPAAASDPALDSVMAQFEMLQQDLAKRRARTG